MQRIFCVSLLVISEPAFLFLFVVTVCRLQYCLQIILTLGLCMWESSRITKLLMALINLDNIGL